MKIVMLFPGYSSQFVGMGKELYDEYRIVQEYFEQASNCIDINFLKLCFASSDTELAKIANAYTSIFLVSCAITAVLKDNGIVPDAVAGYNQGEYSALYAANGIEFADGLYLLNKFASFYQEALENMDAVMIRIKGITAQELEELCVKANTYSKDMVSIAFYNDETNHIVSGSRNAVDRLRELVAYEYQDARIDEITPAIGLHSYLMDSVAKNFAMYLEKVDFKDLEAPLISGLDGRLVFQGAQIKDRMVKDIYSPIVWTRIIDALDAFDLIIEVGPGSKMSDMIKTKYPDKKFVNVNKPSDIEKLKMIIPKEKDVEQN